MEHSVEAGGVLQVEVRIKRRVPFKAGAELMATVELTVGGESSEDGFALSVRIEDDCDA